MNRKEEILVLLLRLVGGITLLAFSAMFLPTEWMEATHRWLGLGRFPASPLVEYLTRSISGLYAAHGGLLLLVSLDVRSHGAIVTYVGAASVLFGAALTLIDLKAALPLYWILAEGPPLVAVGCAILWLQRGVRPTT